LKTVLLQNFVKLASDEEAVCEWAEMRRTVLVEHHLLLPMWLIFIFWLSGFLYENGSSLKY
jgi:hypothetical protein